MQTLRGLVAAIALIAVGLMGSNAVTAQEAPVAVYPPMAPCDAGFSFWFDGDEVVPGYEACDIVGAVDLGTYQATCPDGTSFSPANGGCILASDGENGGHQPWRDGPRGHCDAWMDGYACDLWQQGYDFPDADGSCMPPAQLIPGEASGLGVDTCQTFNQEDGNGGATESGDKGIYPVINVDYPVYISADGDGAHCRATPDGDILVTLPDGTEVKELADGLQDGWQLVAYKVGQSACYVDASLLSDSPAIQAVTDQSDSDQPAIVPVDNDSQPVVQLPSTGVGSTAGQAAAWTVSNLLGLLALCCLGGAVLIGLGRKYCPDKAAGYPAKVRVKTR